MSPDALEISEPPECCDSAAVAWPVPKGWVWCPLHLFLIETGASIDPRRQPTSKFVLYSVPAFDHRRPEQVFGKDIGSAKRRVDPRSVLLCRINPRINRAWLVSEHEEHPDRVIASTEWVVFPPDPAVDPKYLRYFLSTERIRQYLSTNVSGVGGSLMRVSPYTVGAAVIPIAPLAEQRRIVARIDELFAEIAEGEAALERARQGLDTWRRALLKAAVTGELTRDWREANRPAEVGTDAAPIIRQNAPVPKSIPRHWIWTTIGEAGQVLLGRQRAPSITVAPICDPISEC